MKSEEIPKEIEWQNVRMLTIEDLTVTVLFQGDDAPKVYRFASKAEKDEVMGRWFGSHYAVETAGGPPEV